MPKGLLAFKVITQCRVCETDFDKTHYKQKHCSEVCKNKDYYSRHRKTQLSKESQLRKRYKLSIDDYNLLLTKFNSCCALCSKDTDLCIDHDHQTNEIRGILCRTCNMMLGLAKDSPELLQKAQDYLLSGEGGIADLKKLEAEGKR